MSEMHMCLWFGTVCECYKVKAVVMTLLTSHDRQTESTVQSCTRIACVYTAHPDMKNYL